MSVANYVVFFFFFIKLKWGVIEELGIVVFMCVECGGRPSGGELSCIRKMLSLLMLLLGPLL